MHRSQVVATHTTPILNSAVNEEESLRVVW
jgi:hypothetical protein